MWTEQVHASRSRALARSKQPEQLRFVKDADTAPNSKALPMVLATSVIYLAVWWSRESRKVGGPTSPLSWLSQLFKRGGKRTSQKKSNSWKQQRPSALAAVAADRRAQVSEGLLEGLHSTHRCFPS